MNTFNECLRKVKIVHTSWKLAVDESMTYTDTRSSFNIHIKSKPAKQGHIYYCLGDSEYPFIYNFLYHRGKHEKTTSNVGTKILMKGGSQIMSQKMSVPDFAKTEFANTIIFLLEYSWKRMEQFFVLFLGAD